MDKSYLIEELEALTDKYDSNDALKIIGYKDAIRDAMTTVGRILNEEDSLCGSKGIKRIIQERYHYVEGAKVAGAHSNLSGNCSCLRGECSGLSGDCSGLIGNCTGLIGNCTGLRGECSGLSGNLNECKITEEDRKNNIDIATLVDP